MLTRLTSENVEFPTLASIAIVVSERALRLPGVSVLELSISALVGAFLQMLTSINFKADLLTLHAFEPGEHVQLALIISSGGSASLTWRSDLHTPARVQSGARVHEAIHLIIFHLHAAPRIMVHCCTAACTHWQIGAGGCTAVLKSAKWPIQISTCAAEADVVAGEKLGSEDAIDKTRLVGWPRSSH